MSTLTEIVIFNHSNPCSEGCRCHEIIMSIIRRGQLCVRPLFRTNPTGHGILHRHAMLFS